ncbi:hypothetical protein [Sinorhizobium sp. BG8]|uniref:ATP-binding protein n=1 Tax=Sinorhizobium sp. BG8 TaxID=2613773 RepID=UPI00193E151F|nr:hypothetical protein [Sinorhizobium sp. BG8]QRM54998.1 hypothetical protein F3Y30_10915 [Sinorhizobium sp. BG8]
MLPVLQNLSQQVEEARKLDYRIAGMRRDTEQFSEAIATLSQRLGMPEASSDPLDGLAMMTARIQAAKETETYRMRAEADRAKLQGEARELAEQRAVHEARSAEICTFLRCESLGEAAALLAQHARRRDVLARLDQAGSDIARQLLVATEEEAESILAAVDEPQLVAERSELQALFDEQDREVRDLHVARTKAADDLARVGDDDTVARIDEHQKTLLLELADRARRYLSNQAGILAAEQALRLYRERHRSAMMDRASEAFRLISGGEYTGLATVAEKDSELLIANAAAGGSKLARDLSKGTRFQLYFALRVAGYHEIAANREILPFIADDIMETFDDERALNTFRLMGHMAKTGQVIYLTHHQHLRDIARQACPDVVVHEL